MTSDIETTIGAGIGRAEDVNRVFLIDPDVVNRSALYFMVSATNETHEFSSIAALAEANARLTPDLVIVNALLVAGHGKALIQGWRIAWPRVKILVICEACDSECVIAASAAGADDTLLRPFKPEAVRRKIARWTERTIEADIKMSAGALTVRGNEGGARIGH